jgi:hypothetical protein
MLPPLVGAKREVEDEVGVEGVRDTTECRQPRLVLATFEPSDWRLRDAATPCEFGLRESLLDPEGHELAGDLLPRRELLQRRLLLRSFRSSPSRSVTGLVGMVSALVLLGLVVGQVLLRLTTGALESERWSG